MPCERCLAQFTLLRRKRACGECGRWFCGGCVRRTVVAGVGTGTGAGTGVGTGTGTGTSTSPTCAACRVLCSRPLVRSSLEGLRVRDLQTFLHRRHVSTASCVEKEDLIDLVLTHVNSADFVPRSPSQNQNEFAQTFASIKGFVSNVVSALDIGSSDKSKQHSKVSTNIPTASTTSSNNQPPLTVPVNKPTTSQTAPTSPREPPPNSSRDPLNIPSSSPVHPPQCIVTDTSADSIPNIDTNDCLEVEDDPDDPDWEIISPPADPLPQDSDVLLLDSDTPLRASVRAASDLDLPSRTGDSSSADTSSLKDIPAATINSNSRINLNDLKDVSQVEALKVKQLKELLILNRVDFKGCCERNELLERAKRLWQENTKSREDLEASEGQELCRICMDAPMECVMLECGHIATCISCGKRLTECPICRGYVVRVVRFFKS